MTILEKIQKAIELIKSENLKKQGKNTFSKYDYYTPEQVAELVTKATHTVKLLVKFDMKRNELGITGTLSIYDVETPTDPFIYEMATAIPDIKATNIAQQIGGAMTYTKRYLMMNAFDIVDNNLDFDTTENTQKLTKSEKEEDAVLISIKNALNACKSQEALKKMWEANPELHTDSDFIKLVTARKKILTDNQITE